MKKPIPTYQEVLDYVRPPVQITGYPHLEELLSDPTRLSLIELEVFRQMPALLSKLSGVSGDVLSAGIWRGGFALALQTLIIRSTPARSLLLADTFGGFPVQESRFEKDEQAQRRFNPLLQAHFPKPRQVLDHFIHLGLPTQNIEILIGDVRETLTHFEQPLSLIHIDLDLYEPTLATLALTYDQLQPGGLVIVDDYGTAVFGCREAVEEFRKDRAITAGFNYLSQYCVYWQKHE